MANANLLVKNLPDATKAVDIRTLVSQYGKVCGVNKCTFWPVISRFSGTSCFDVAYSISLE